MKKIIYFDTLILFSLLIISALFRFYRLRTAPDWFADEGEFLRLMSYLSKGSFDFLGIRNSVLLIGRPPLFLWVLAGITKIFGLDILVLRSLAVVCSIITIGICYIFTRQALGRTTAFYAAFLLAILPEYIFYNRIGFSYNWTTLWMLIFVYTLWKYLTLDSQRWLVVACLAAGIAFASDYLGIVCIFVLFLAIIFTQPRQLLKMVIVGIPWLVSMLPIFTLSPADVWHDLRYSFMLGSGSEGNLFVKLAIMIAKYSEVIRRQPLIVLGILGIFILNDKRLRTILLLMLAGIFVILLPSRVLLGHYLLPVWPLIMIGVGSFLEKSITFIYGFLRSSFIELRETRRFIINETLWSSIGSIGSILIVFVVIFIPITWMIILSLESFVVEPINSSSALIDNPWKEGFIPAADAEAVANKISPTLKPEDFVIAPGVISWLLPSNAADPRTVVVYEYGGKSLGMSDFNQERFTVDSSISNAKYAVVDDSWRVWMVNMAPEIATMLEEVEKWPLMMERGSLQLFCNPTFCQ